jgi:hypothetical protein
MAAFAIISCSDNSDPVTAPGTAGPTAQAPGIATKKASRNLTAAINDPAFTGTLRITSFAVQNGQLVANGVLNGTTGTGATVTNLQVPNIPVNTSQQDQGCQILPLELGPIFLNLLGLQLTTNEIVIDLTAVPGPGNLLGNLLCAIVGLLDQTPLNIGLINQILAQINNLLNSF